MRSGFAPPGRAATRGGFTRSSSPTRTRQGTRIAPSRSRASCSIAAFAWRANASGSCGHGFRSANWIIPST